MKLEILNINIENNLNKNLIYYINIADYLLYTLYNTIEISKYNN